MAERGKEFVCDFKKEKVVKISLRNGTEICSNVLLCNGWECSLKKNYNNMNPDDLLSGTSLGIFSPFSLS